MHKGRNMKKIIAICTGAALVAALYSCDDRGGATPDLPDEQESWIEIETYAGGELGTTFNRSASAFEDPTPAVELAGMEYDFKQGEYFFERSFTENTAPFDGLGPLYLRSSCLDCHPGYGHGKRMERYRWNDYGNGYLLVLYDPKDNSYLTSLTGMPQTQAVAPFKAPLDETKISIEWKEYVDEWGNKFEDGETYSLIYPEVTIPADAYYVPVLSKNGPLDASEVGIRLESTIGIYGSGLIDAIPDDSLLVQYRKEEAMGMLKAGNAGSSYASQSLVMQAICDGCITIADEVATQKIGRPYNGTTEEDIAYIESPYSHKSIQDFYDNMVSIKNVYYGGLDAESMGASADSYDRTNSLHAWFQETDPDFDARMTAAIDKALAEINGDGTGMVKPFVNNRQDASVGEAIEAISALNEVLIEAKGRFTE